MRTGPARDDGRKLAVPTPAALADRLGVSAAAVVFGVLGVFAVAVAGWWALRPPPGPDVETILPAAGAVPIPTPAPTAAPSPAIVVHVIGAVTRPGVHELPAGSRVVDAVGAAGGLTAAADSARLNLAEPLGDGARLWVPAVGEQDGPDVVSATPGAVGPGVGAPGGTGPQAATVDINTADVAGLQALPGIGPSLAAAIVEHRNRSGPFATVDGLDSVAGIGPAKLEQVRPMARV